MRNGKTGRRGRRRLSLKNNLLLIVSVLLVLQAFAVGFSIKLGRNYALQDQFDKMNSDYTSIMTALTIKNSMIESLMDTLSYTYSVRDVLKEKSVYGVDDDRGMLLRILNSYTDLDACIDSVLLVSLTGEDDFIYQFYSAMGDYSQMIENAAKNIGYSDWSWLSGKRIFTISDQIYVGNTMTFPVESKSPQAIGIFFINLDALLNEIGLYDGNENIHFMLLDGQGRSLSNAGAVPEAIRACAAALPQEDDDPMSRVASVDGVDYAFYGSILEPMGWKLVGYAPVTDAQALFQRTIQPMLMIWIGIAALTIMLVVFVVTSLYRFVSHMLKHMALMRKGVWDQPMRDSNLQEFSTISENFNDMMTHIRLLHNQNIDIQKRLLEREINERQILLMALQAQINPHFLYNTLECIKSIGVYYGIDEIRVIAQSLAYMFKYSIKSAAIVTVQEEIECVRNFMAIQNIRFDSRFRLHVSIGEALEQVRLPKMLFQPLVENALKHGLEGKIGVGNVWLDVRADEENRLCASVRDDGEGIPEEQLRALLTQLSRHDGVMDENRTSIGLANIAERLYLHYNDRAKLTITSELGRGTTISIQIPIGEEDCNV
ncbi:MAG: sensor histidine kinase [Clostridia bacterium]|nr:sensor histidine kinase [Clostridia bacterium]